MNLHYVHTDVTWGAVLILDVLGSVQIENLDSDMTDYTLLTINHSVDVFQITPVRNLESRFGESERNPDSQSNLAFILP